MGYAERVVRVDDRRVERAEADRPLGVFDCLFGTAGMAKDDGPEASASTDVPFICSARSIAFIAVS